MFGKEDECRGMSGVSSLDHVLVILTFETLRDAESPAERFCQC